MGRYPGTWFDPDWRKDPDKPHGRAERLWDPEQAEKILRIPGTGVSGTNFKETWRWRRVPSAFQAHPSV